MAIAIPGAFEHCACFSLYAAIRSLHLFPLTPHTTQVCVTSSAMKGFMSHFANGHENVQGFVKSFMGKRRHESICKSVYENFRTASLRFLQLKLNRLFQFIGDLLYNPRPLCYKTKHFALAMDATFSFNR